MDGGDGQGVEEGRTCTDRELDRKLALIEELFSRLLSACDAQTKLWEHGWEERKHFCQEQVLAVTAAAHEAVQASRELMAPMIAMVQAGFESAQATKRAKLRDQSRVVIALLILISMAAGGLSVEALPKLGAFLGF